MSPRLLGVACFVAFAAAALPIRVAADGPPQGVAQDGIGIVSPDGKTRYVTWTSGSNVVLEAVNTRGGEIVDEVVLHGPFAIPAIAWTPTGITPDGKTLVLTTWPWRSGPATFLILSAPDFETKDVVKLPGSWSYDAISPRARTLFLIQSLAGGRRYRVRAYDLHGRRLLGRIVADRRETGPMVGSPAGRAETRDGRWVFTLYDRANGTAFVHMLDAVRRTAVCVDLKAKGWNDPWDTRVWLSADGSSLHLRQLGAARLAVDLDTRAWRARAT